MIIDVMYTYGDTPCGLGVVIDGCQCCYDQFACSSITQLCGTTGCVNNPAFFPAGGCAAGTQPCGGACIDASAACCSSATGSHCPAGDQCDGASDRCVTGNNGSATVSASGLPGTTASSSVGKGTSSAAAQSVGERAFGWRANAWMLLAIEAILLFVTGDF